MIQIPMKPVSTNSLYVGKRYLSGAARRFKSQCRQWLTVSKNHVKPPHGKLEIHYIFGLSKDMDVTNCVKLFEDVIANFYGFNDARVAGCSQRKIKVERGEEFMAFSLRKFDEHAFARFQNQV